MLAVNQCPRMLIPDLGHPGFKDAHSFTLCKALPSVVWPPLFFQGQLLLPASPQHHSEMPQGTAGTLPRADFTPLNLVPSISRFIENTENMLGKHDLESEVPKLTKYYGHSSEALQYQFTAGGCFQNQLN
ncbi:hypothetical protein CB1_001891003 [Camelus ferus]|nr:hypothetical protein CB1_001891003 [Camelus ferus]